VTLEVWNGAAISIGSGGGQTTTSIAHVIDIIANNQWSGATLAVTWSGNIATTATPHGLQDGTPIVFSGALPSGLSAGVPVYARYLTDTTFQVCATLANVLSWSGVNPTPTLLTIGNGTPTMRIVHATVVFDSNTLTSALRNWSSVITDTDGGAKVLTVSAMPSAAQSGDTAKIYPTYHQSGRFSATVGGSAAFVYGHSQGCRTTTQKYTNVKALEVSWLRFGSDTAASVAVTNLSGAIASYEIIPDNIGVTASVVGSTITLSLAVEQQVFLIINDDFLHPLAIDCCKLKSSVPAHTTYNGSQTAALAGTCLYFPAGCFTLGARFLMTGTGTIYADDGCMFPGTTFDYRAQSNTGIYGGRWSMTGAGINGGGVMSYVLPFSTGVLNCAALGADITNTGAQYSTVGNFLRDGTIVDPAYYFTNLGPHDSSGLVLLSPYTGGVGGWDTRTDYTTKLGSVDRCLYLNSDDHWQLDFVTDGTVTVTRVVHLHTNQGCFHISYWPDYAPTDGSGVVWKNCWVRSISTFDQSWGDPTAPYAPNAIFQALVAGLDGQERLAIMNRSFENIYIQGAVACPAWHFENIIYPFSVPQPAPPPGNLKGQIQFMSFVGITFTQAPSNGSFMIGLDRLNTTHDIDFHNVRIAGVLMTVRNWASTFTSTNSFPYNIRVGGRNVVTDVDICNLALSRLGQAAKVTSITPPDGSTEASLCSRFLPMAKNTLQEQHFWNFNTRRAALTLAASSTETSAWDYAYELPDDLLAPIDVIPSDASDDYSQPGRYIDSSGGNVFPDVDLRSTTNAQYVPIPFTIEVDSTGAMVLYTDLVNATLRYTQFQPNANFYGPTLVEALTWYLTGMLAGALIKGEEGARAADRATSTAMRFLASAKEGDAQSRRIRVQQAVPWLNRRR
jgi:hypothetical protein